MMAMDGSLLAAKPYLKSKVQAKGWLIVHTKPGGIKLLTLPSCLQLWPFVWKNENATRVSEYAVDNLLKAE